MRRSEISFLGAVAAFLLLILLFDATTDPRAAEEAQVDQGQFVSTGWYCPVPAAEGLEGTMVTANLGEDALGLRRSAIGGTGQSAVEQTPLPGRRSSSKAVSEFGVADAVGLVEAFGGNNSTNLMVTSRSLGVGSSRCSAQPSSRWLFATGSTARGENHHLLIANPFREEAVVRVRLLAGDKEVVPARLRDLVIRTLSQTSVYLPDYLVEEPGFGIEVTASRGRVVVSRYSNVTTGGGDGISLDVGARSPSSHWVFAEGRVPSDGEDSVVIVNPGTREALVGIVFMTEAERTAPPELAELPVPAGRQVVVNVSDHLPRGTSYGVELTSTNDVPVVVERRSAGVYNGNRSYESAFGVTETASRWVVPAGSPAGGAATLALVNTGRARMTAEVTLLTPDGETTPDALSSIRIEPGRKVVVDLGPHLGGALGTAVVEADQRSLAVESLAVLGPPHTDFAASAGQPAP
jgi:hypothetical protein